MRGQKVFALDIGTRSVVGIILEESGEQYHVLDLVVKEHQDRAMVDGQIHDISAVVKVISDVKVQLEKIHGPLTRVCVAAAGRALKTERAKSTVNITGKPIFSKEDIVYLELTAVQNAQAVVAEKQEQAADKLQSYYCVGYSVLHYFLDNEMIGNLIDHQGDEASVEIIATFLPKVVVDSLIKALQRAGLQLDALTLEPIAAINVLVPVSMRRLNVALVDIGAGTSDIAITNAGTVVAYGMVPSAGDEVTEAISDQLLLDFPDAEQAKRDLWNHDFIVVNDILGFENNLSKAEVVNQISPAIDKLSKEISDEIKVLNNGQSPKAVMLVGGGSMTPELPKRIAQNLDLPENRVAIRGADAIQGLTFADSIPGGPENITPIGIAISARKSPIQYVTVTVNERTIRMFEVKKLTVADCILASGITINKLYGKPGMAIFVNMNGQNLTIPGSYGEPPVILKNGKVCNLEDPVSDGDELTAQNGEDGKQSRIKISEFIDEIPVKQAVINGERYEVHANVHRNGKSATLHDFIEDNDTIRLHFPETIEELLLSLDLYELFDMLKPFRLQMNGKETFLPTFSGSLLLNGRVAKHTDLLPANIDISITRKNQSTAGNLASAMQHVWKHTITVFYQHKEITLEKAALEYMRDGIVLKQDDMVHTGDIIEFNQKDRSAFIFQDIFNYVEVEKPEKSSGHFTILRNDDEATFYTPLHSGDRLDIVWPITSEIK